MNDSFQNECTSLDDYLDRELAGEAALRFETHLANCGACRDAVAQQRWIDDALRSSIAVHPAAPAVLRTAMSESIAAATLKQRQRRLLTASFAVAASVAIVATVTWRMLPLAPGSARGLAATPHNVAQRNATPGRSPGLEDGPRSSGSLPLVGRVGEGTPDSSLSRSGGVNPVATFTAGGDGIAVPIASDSPEVTIVQFYTTTEASRRQQQQRELEAKYHALIGG